MMWGTMQDILLSQIDRLTAEEKLTQRQADDWQHEIINARGLDDLPAELQQMAEKVIGIIGK